jgi:hypothetical protein
VAIKDWEKSILDRELMEKRRVAPGYLDTDLRILEPTRVGAGDGAKLSVQKSGDSSSGGDLTSTAEGEELDKVFGKMIVG